MQLKIPEAQTSREIARCFPVMRQLRTHFEDEQTFVAQVQRQRSDGFRLAFLEDDEGVRAVAGYRMSESLYAGRFCYVDDLVTDEAARSLGYGGALFSGSRRKRGRPAVDDWNWIRACSALPPTAFT